jgi:COP9 signalosome complex subunit 4
VLAPSGPQRSRLLSVLYKDTRALELTNVFPILEAVHLKRILKRALLEHFRTLLMDHHLAANADGSNVLDRAVLEHNIGCAAQMYSQVQVNSLAERLGEDSSVVETVVADMICEGRLQGKIDQVDGFVEFEHESEEDGRKQVCMAVERAVAAINA